MIATYKSPTAVDERRRQKRWAEYAARPSSRLREELIRDYAPLARRAVDRLQIAPWGCVTRDDLLGYAILGLIDAIDRYEPDKGASFEAFAMPRLRGAVLDGLRRLDWAPRSLRAEESRLRAAFGNLEAELGRAPNTAEVAQALGMTEEALDELLSEVARTSLVSLDDLVAGMDSSPMADLVLGSDRNGPHRERERAEAQERLRAAIAALPERERQLVGLYYFQEMTFKEIGQILEVTEQRVSQLHARAMLRLSHKLLRHQELLLGVAA